MLGVVGKGMNCTMQVYAGEGLLSISVFQTHLDNCIYVFLVNKGTDQEFKDFLLLLFSS